MNYLIPKPLKVEHEELHAQLLKATQEEGEVGLSAKEVAKLLHNHFIKEEEYAIPPLGLLDALSKGIVSNEMKSVLDMTEKLKAQLPKMLEEHKLIIEALHNLISASKNENMIQYAEFAEKLILHAQMEEEVIYPAAILVGEYIKLKLQ